MYSANNAFYFDRVGNNISGLLDDKSAINKAQHMGPKRQAAIAPNTQHFCASANTFSQTKPTHVAKCYAFLCKTAENISIKDNYFMGGLYSFLNHLSPDLLTPPLSVKVNFNCCSPSSQITSFSSVISINSHIQGV